ncbi:MAG: site-specific integrase [Lachnospiraceae bacterium]|nr:site-specific integrase [Lachnospiraceae bacterium]
MRFVVYNHTLITLDGTRINRKFIALKLDDGTLRFTNLHKYIFPKKRNVRPMSADSNNRVYFIVQLLNYAFFTCGIHALSELTVEMVSDFLNDYGNCELPDDDDDTSRSKQTVEKCICSIMDFLENLLAAFKGRMSFKREALYQEIQVRNKRGQVIKKIVPVFPVLYKDNGAVRRVYRDMPNEAFKVIFGHIFENHKEILMLVALSAFAGLRPSEACNVRREDSRLGPGLLFEIVAGETTGIKIDLNHEYVLRSDLKPVGCIKKERMQKVPDIFLDAFVVCYNEYMKYIEGRWYEADYGPLSINRQCKAYTYPSYRQQFQKIIKNEIVPLLLGSNDPELVIYGHTLMEHNISPHIFRHWYTVQLVLSGINDPGTLMKLRGDTSPESSLVYLQDKGDLEREYRKVSNEAFNYLKWAARRLSDD